jgi:ribosome-binding ATPase YchF (GTP1/OBG family)
MQELVAPAEAIFLDAKFESELVELDDEDEAREMLHEMGVEEPGLDILARVGFDTLGLQTYLTAGPKESRAWTIRKGATAPRRPASSTPTSSAASSRPRSSRTTT